MLSFKSKRTESGRIKYTSDQGVNDDICNALTLAVRAWKQLRGSGWNPNDEKKKIIAYGKNTHFSGSKLPTMMGQSLERGKY